MKVAEGAINQVFSVAYEYGSDDNQDEDEETDGIKKRS